jgi:hypothetical protein
MDKLNELSLKVDQAFGELEVAIKELSNYEKEMYECGVVEAPKTAIFLLLTRPSTDPTKDAALATSIGGCMEILNHALAILFKQYPEQQLFMYNAVIAGGKEQLTQSMISKVDDVIKKIQDANLMDEIERLAKEGEDEAQNN